MGKPLAVCENENEISRDVSAVRAVWLRQRASYLSEVGTNANESFLEADSHADTTCLRDGALNYLILKLL